MKASSGQPEKQILPIYWVVLSVVIIVLDYISGPIIQFPIMYLIPIAIASWYHGRWWGIFLAVSLPLIRFYYSAYLWVVPWTTLDASLNFVIRVLVLSSFAILIDMVAVKTKLLAKKVQTLEGLLPICSFCKKIRDENNQWEMLEEYIRKRSTANFSHGICPDCYQKNYANLM